jgi:hypothetical protein
MGTPEERLRQKLGLSKISWRETREKIFRLAGTKECTSLVIDHYAAVALKPALFRSCTSPQKCWFQSELSAVISHW